ncbi:ATP/GTP-binding protein [Streptomyces sp. NPDC058657]|uniref:ATP/GTP-binding protein n=1 Tax=unclassified Streptomyces TaxID=2593676 RepID=UPI00365D1138
MLRRPVQSAVASVLLAAVLAPAAQADDGPTVNGGQATCGRGSVFSVTVCAADSSSSPGLAGSSGAAGVSSAKPPKRSTGGQPPTCTYEKVTPQPPAGSPLWEGRKPGKGAIWIAVCDDTQTSRPVWIADGAAPAPAAPAIDPEVVAQQAIDAARLDGPKVASPKPGRPYLIGLPVWMWVEPTESTYGPTTATATAGGVTVSATATVTSIAWTMGDGTTVTCPGPGTPYSPARGTSPSPDCGHRYTRLARPLGQPYRGTATSTWTVDWQVVGGTGETGTFTETRQTPFTLDLHEMQAVGTAP